MGYITIGKLSVCTDSHDLQILTGSHPVSLRYKVGLINSRFFCYQFTQGRREDSELKLVQEIKAMLAKRNKLIKIADRSEMGWRTVAEYESYNLAEDSADERRIVISCHVFRNGQQHTCDQLIRYSSFLELPWEHGR